MFVKGDIVIGLPGNGYRITGHNAVCKVMSIIDEKMMRVKLVETKANFVSSNANPVGVEFKVRQKGFILQSGRTNQMAARLLHKGDAFG